MVDIALLPATPDQQLRLQRYAERGGWYFVEDSMVRWEHPDTGSSFRLTPSPAGWRLGTKLPAALEAGRDCALAIRDLPGPLRPALPQGQPWDVDAWVERWQGHVEAALARVTSRPTPVEDATLRKVWGWNRIRHELAAQFPSVLVAGAWLVRLGDRVTSAAVWVPPTPIFLPQVEIVLVQLLDGLRGVSFDAVTPLLDPSCAVEGGWAIHPGDDARWHNVWSTGAPDPAFQRIGLGEVIEQSLVDDARRT